MVTKHEADVASTLQRSAKTLVELFTKIENTKFIIKISTLTSTEKQRNNYYHSSKEVTRTQIFRA